ncbi:MAG TPA: hypothetical protein VGL21_16890 [Jatrophihabitantaceae bacterium]|jgi:hypothetical protein
MSVVGTRWFKVAGVLAASGTLVLSTQAASDAHPNRGLPTPLVISTTVSTAGGYTLPAQIHAGLVTFRIGASDTDYHGIQGFSLNRGVTLDQAMDDINLTLSGGPDAGMGAMNLTRDVTEIGAVTTTPYAPQEVTVPLTKGTYYFLDLNEVDNPPLTPHIHTMTVVGDFRLSIPQLPTTVIQGLMINDQPRFKAPATMKHDGTFLGLVTGDELHEIVLRPAVPGTTDAYLDTFYEAVVNGTPRPPSPWLGSAAGMQSISPGRWAIVHLNLPPGLYALVCYVPSMDGGLPHTYVGMHQMITLT